jgi:sulfate transport system ATP-binding protein
MSIEIKNVSKTLNYKRVLQNIDLLIDSGEFTALLGPSGSGKTTLLRIIAGLEVQNDGAIFLDGEDILQKPLHKRGIGFVFQHYALFKHMNVFENVAFGLNIKAKKENIGSEEIIERVFSLLKLMQLDDLHKQYPFELSGGQQQRIALARALAVEPKILLLDEAFGALDQKVRKELRRWLRKLHDKMNITSLLVTHDQEEAMEIADKIVIMNQGRIEQVGSPKSVYHFPKNSFVYDFLGNYNAFEGVIDRDGIAHIKELTKPVLKNPIKKLSAHFKDNVLTNLFKRRTNISEVTQNYDIHPQGPIIKLFARPHQMEISRELIKQDAIHVRLVYINEAAPLIKLEFERKDESIIQVEITKERFQKLQPKKGEYLYVYPLEIKVFKE